MSEPDTQASNNTGWMNDVQKTLAYFTTVSYVLLIFLWTFFPPKMEPESMAQLNQMMTTLQTLLVGAFGFFLGSSMSSKTKDETQAKVAEKLAERVALVQPISPSPENATVITTVPAEPATTPTVTTVTTQEPKP